MAWKTSDIPDLTGRTAVITGVTGGLGTQTAIALARAGATVIGTARNTAKADVTRSMIDSAVPGAQFRVINLNLADLTQTKAAAASLRSEVEHIDILINNAGIMIPPESKSVDGFELQMATNHLGHFAWTATLWPALGSARIVTVASLAHTFARDVDLDLLTSAGSTRRYRRWNVYGQSKLANLVFAMELHRRINSAGLDTVAVAAHPGIAATELTKTGPSVGRFSLIDRMQHVGAHAFMQSAAAGAWPSLRAATDPSLAPGSYIGPAHVGQTRGTPVEVGMKRIARDPRLGRNLWTASEAATGVAFLDL